MLCITFRKLPAGSAKDVLTRDPRLAVQERQHILQLIAEPERAARLIKGRSRMETTRQRLISEPPVRQHV